jgi:hypothetical protein
MVSNLEDPFPRLRGSDYRIGRSAAHPGEVRRTAVLTCFLEVARPREVREGPDRGGPGRRHGPFLAPEQILNFREAEPAVDQYATGATLYGDRDSNPAPFR